MCALFGDLRVHFIFIIILQITDCSSDRELCLLLVSRFLNLVSGSAIPFKKRTTFFVRHLGSIGGPRDDCSACNEPILDFLDANSNTTDALETNLVLFFRHLAE